jgi:hypothetical protein
MSDKMIERNNNHEIDLVDIVAVIMKRKLFIIIFLISAFLLAIAYVIGIGRNNYVSTIVITPPKVFDVYQNGFLKSDTPQIENFVFSIKEFLGKQLNIHTNIKKDRYFTYTVSFPTMPKEHSNSDELSSTIVSKINIELTGQEEKLIKVITSLYQLFLDFENRVAMRNDEIMNLTTRSHQNALTQKKNRINKLSMSLNNDTLINVTEGSEETIIQQINTLNSEITEIEMIMKINAQLELSRGSFIIVNKEISETIINKDNLKDVGSYITPKRPIERSTFIVIISAVISFIVSVLLAFIIEFFSKEDVKKRLQELKSR